MLRKRSTGFPFFPFFAGTNVAVRWLALVLTVFLYAFAPAAAGAERLCDPAHEDCRTPLLELIRAETGGIDVAFWFMEDPRYTNELIRRWQAGVPVRVLMDTRANSSNPLNRERLAELRNAGIPMRERVASGILHWKMMLFSAQNTVHFSGANYSEWAFVPVEPYRNYVDEAIYFTAQASVVNSFRTKFDDLWTNTSAYRDYGNISGPPARRYPTYPKDPELNFAPNESFRSRSIARYNAENIGIDVIMYRITDRGHSDAIINATQRGVPVRLITEPVQYRDPTRLWHSWNVDRLYMAGVQIRHRAHAGLLHQKSVLLKGQQMTIFGSSNWTSPSSDSQEEHNYFTSKGWIASWFSSQFERKWNNLASSQETEPFQPLPPGSPDYLSPSNGSAGASTTSVLRFDAGPFAHLYDVYFGVSKDPPLIEANVPLGPTTSAASPREYRLPPLAPGTTYYWRVVAKTMAQQRTVGSVWMFTTSGAPRARRGDFDGDGGAEIAIWRPSTGRWYTRLSSTGYSDSREHHWGASGDVPVPGDYDGDARHEIAVWRPSTGQWFIRLSTTGYANYWLFNWGTRGDVPVPGDFDGDGRADLAVWRPSTGQWFVLRSATNYAHSSLYTWGIGGDVPVPADFDGDGRAEIAIWRPSTGQWYVRLSTSNYSSHLFHAWGARGDTPLTGDYDGDGRAEIGIWRPANGRWYIRWSSTNWTSFTEYLWGVAGDTVMDADFDGDGRADLVAWRPSTGRWFVRGSASQYATYALYDWGVTGDLAVPAFVR
jgi:hypothetical protein